MSTAPATPPVPLRIKLAYGLGAVAYGVKDNGFAVFVLIFYNQVIGLSAALVGLAVMVALIVDAFIDPLIGHLSDRTNSRWGRRHPWLYASVLPMGASWFLLWHPPEWSDTGILIYLTLSAILVRAAIALNEVPSLAMLPEITRDYHERTDVIRYRYLLGWSGGLFLLLLAYGVFLAPTADQPAGLLNRAGYDAYAWTGTIMMMAAILLSALGTHRRLARPPASLPPRQPVMAELRAMRRTLSNRAFLVLMLAGVFAYANQGLNFATSTYMQSYVWEFPRWAMIAWPFTLLGGIAAAFVITPPIARRLGKKDAAAAMATVAVVVGLAPYALRLAGLFPPNGAPATLPIFLTTSLISTACAIGPMMLVGSMLADVIEDHEIRSHHREEGLFFAGNMFMQKCVTGLGTFAAGSLISAIDFPDDAVPGAVDPAIITDLIWLFTVLTALLIAGTVAAFLRFPLGQADHEARLAILAARQPAP